MKKHFLIAGLSALVLAAPMQVCAYEADLNEVSRLLQQGEILPLSTILEMVRPVTGPHILAVEVEQEDFGLAYEIYFLNEQGRRHEIYVDARSGEIMLQKPDPR